MSHCSFRATCHCSSVLSCKGVGVVTLPSLHQCSTSIRWTFVGHSFNVHWIFVQLSLDIRLTFVGRPSNELSSNFRLTVILRPMSYLLTSCILPSCLFIWLSFDVCLTLVQRLSLTGHSRRHTIFFKLYVGLELCSKWFVLLQNFVHGTTPCPEMMKALSFSESPNISYEVTQNPLSQFL